MPVTEAWIEKAYRCAIGEESWDVALRPLLAETKAFCVGGVNHTIMPLSVKLHINVDGPVEAERAYVETYVHENPIMDTLCSLSPGKLITGFSRPGNENHEESKFFREYQTSQNIADILWVSIARRPGDFFMLAFPRLPDAGPFTQADIERFEPYVPHLVRAFDVWLKLNMAKAENEWVTSAMDQVANGMITLGPNRTIFYANRAAENFLSSMRMARRQSLKLRFADAAVDQQFQAILDGQSKPGNEPNDNILILRRGAQQAPLLLRVEPVENFNTEAPVPKAVAVIYIVDPNSRILLSLNAFARAYSLTQAETRLLENLVKLGSIVEAAEMASIAESTARTHIRNVYAKTNVNTLGQLLLKAYRAALL